MINNQIKKNKKMNNKGFSLVELIVVIAIMAVLVGVLAPQLIKYVEKARQSTDIQTCDNIATALKTYYADVEGTAKVTVTVTDAAPAGISDGSNALKDAGLEDATLTGNWEKDTIEITYDQTTGQITYKAESDYYEANGTSKINKKAVAGEEE